MKRQALLFMIMVAFASLSTSQTLLPGIQIDEVDGQTIYTCDAQFFDSGGHYVDC